MNDKKCDRMVLSELDSGPKSHDQLCERIGIDWDKLQSSIRRLRNDGRVVLTLDRKYEREDKTGDVDT